MTKNLLFMTLLKSCCIDFDQNYHLVSSERSVTRTDACQSDYYYNVDDGIGDGICDDDFNNEECDWDGGDCCGDDVNTIFCSECECLNPNFKEPFNTNNGYNIGNIHKWDYCNECECLDPYDAGDSHSASESLHACGSPAFFNDNYCDDENNNEECSWDGGDCCSNFHDLCSSKCNKDEKCCQIIEFEHWHDYDHGPSGSDFGLPASGFGPPASGYGPPSGSGNGPPPKNVFGYRDVYCKPFVDEITGCELFCDPVCTVLLIVICRSICKLVVI